MKKILLLLLSLLAFAEIAFCQEKMEIEGAIILKDSDDPNPKPGTIRFNTTTNDFEGWNGAFWASLTGIESVSDIDGNLYLVVSIGTQDWLAQNLRTTKYNNGDAIPNVADNSEWFNLNSGAYSWYNNNNGFEQPYGKLYNGFAVQDSRGLCPSGWDVPSDAEWTTLTDYLGGTSVAGGPMKEAGTAHWNSPNAGATNESAFSALPGGSRSLQGRFDDLGSIGAWWSSTENNGLLNIRFLSLTNGGVVEFDIPKKQGFSVRCVRD